MPKTQTSEKNVTAQQPSARPQEGIVRCEFSLWPFVQSGEAIGAKWCPMEVGENIRGNNVPLVANRVV